MNAGDFIQFVFVITAAVVLGRVGFAVARVIERRASPPPSLPPESDDRLRLLEEECAALRRELGEMQERQDFAERALLQEPSRGRPAAPPPRDPVVTPH